MKLREVILKDVLHNLHPRSGATPEYARGILVGVVATLMATGKSFEQASALAWQLMPLEIMPGSVPDSWHMLKGCSACGAGYDEGCVCPRGF